MHNVDEKYYGHMSTKSKEADEYARTILSLKQEKATIQEKLKESKETIEIQKRELELLTQTNEQKNKRIADLIDVIKSLETKIKEITNT